MKKKRKSAADAALYRAEFAALQAQVQDRAARWKALVEGLAAKHRLTPEAVEEIHNKLGRFA